MFPVISGYKFSNFLKSPIIWMIFIFIALLIPSEINNNEIETQIPIGKEKFKEWWIEKGQFKYAKDGKGVGDDDYKKYETEYVNKFLNQQFVYQVHLVPDSNLFKGHTVITSIFLPASIWSLLLAIVFFSYFGMFLQSRWGAGITLMFIISIGLVANLIYNFWFSAFSVTFMRSPIMGTFGIESAMFVAFLLFHKKDKVILKTFGSGENKKIDYKTFATSWFILSYGVNIALNPSNYLQISILNLFVMMLAYPIIKVIDMKFYVPPVSDTSATKIIPSIQLAKKKVKQGIDALSNYRAEEAWMHIKDGVNMMLHLEEDYKLEIDEVFQEISNLQTQIHADPEEFYDLGQELARKDSFYASIYCLERAANGHLPDMMRRHALYMIVELRISHKIEPQAAKATMIRILKSNNSDPIASKVKRLIKENVDHSVTDLNDELEKIMHEDDNSNGGKKG